MNFVCLEEWVTVDYVCGIRDNLIRRAKLVPWTDEDLSEEISYQQEEPNEQYFNVNHLSLDLLFNRSTICRLAEKMKLYLHQMIIHRSI